MQLGTTDPATNKVDPSIVPTQYPRILAFAGPKTCGKDTAAKYPLSLNAVFGDKAFVQVNFADPLKQVCMAIFGLTHEMCYDPIQKEMPIPWMPAYTPRQILQNVAHMFRTMYAQDIWVRAWERNILTQTSKCIITTDLRHVEELTRIRQLGGKVIYVLNPRVEEIRREGRKVGDPRWSDSSEAYAEMLHSEADCVVTNDGLDVQALHKEVAQTMNELFGDPATWAVTSPSLVAGVSVSVSVGAE